MTDQAPARPTARILAFPSRGRPPTQCQPATDVDRYGPRKSDPYFSWVSRQAAALRRRNAAQPGCPRLSGPPLLALPASGRLPLMTVVLVSDCAEVRVFHYRADSVEQACDYLLRDWLAGKVTFRLGNAADAFTREWLLKYFMESIDPGYVETWVNGVREVEWMLCGPTEGDDATVWGYFIRHGTSRRKRVPPT